MINKPQPLEGYRYRGRKLPAKRLGQKVRILYWIGKGIWEDGYAHIEFSDGFQTTVPRSTVYLDKRTDKRHKNILRRGTK